VVAHHVKARRRDHGAEPGDAVERLEVERHGAVAPGLLHLVAQPPVGQLGEALLGDGGPAEIAADALDLRAVPAIEGGGGVHVEAVDLGDGLAVALELGVDEAQRGLSGPLAETAMASISCSTPASSRRCQRLSRGRTSARFTP